MKKKDTMKKSIALMMGMVMLATIFAALPAAMATPNYSEDNIWGIEITADSLGGTYYPGEQDVSFTITIRNTAGGAETDAAQIDGCNLYIQTGTIRDENGNAVTSPISNWDVDMDEWGGNLANGLSHTFGPFQFDIEPDAAPGTYNFTIDMSFTDNDGTPSGTQHFTGYVLFTIGHNMVVFDAYPDLYAGQTFTDLYVEVDDTWEGVNNLYLNLSAIPSGIHFDQTWGWIPNGVEWDTIGFKVDVDSDMAPGVYSVDYQVQYSNADGVWTTETGTLDITVAFTPVIVSELTGDEITIIQGEESIPAMGVRFINNGNVDLRNIMVTLDYDGIYFFKPSDYYEGAGGEYGQTPVYVNEISIDSLNVGDNTETDWYVALSPSVQEGQHRILFEWSATYFDDGATGNPTHYQDCMMEWWDDDANAYTPRVPRISFSGPWISPWIAGPYVMINVVDEHIDLEAGTMYNVDTGDDYMDTAWESLINVPVGTEITNFEAAYFNELKATLQVGPGTPFWNTLDHGATTVENDMTLSDYQVTPGGTADMVWRVDINPNAEPGVYMLDMVISGRNRQTTEYFNTTIQVPVYVRGMGPVVMVTSVVNSEIVPGQTFDMNLTISNEGDDTARNVFVWVPTWFTGVDWEIIDGFVDSISSYNRSDNAWGSADERNVSSNGITLEQLNINDAKDIVDLGLYIEGVFSSPTAEIWFLKIDNLAPGESVNVVFKMLTNVNMVNGRPYFIDVEIQYTDSYGDSWYMYTPITVSTDNPGVPYHSTADNAFAEITSNNVGLLMLFILFLIFIVLVIGLSMMKGDKKPPAEAEPVVGPEPIYEEPVTDEAIESGEVPSAFPEGTEPGPGYAFTENGDNIAEPEDMEDEEISGEEPGFTLEEKEEGESSF